MTHASRSRQQPGIGRERAEHDVAGTGHVARQLEEYGGHHTCVEVSKHLDGRGVRHGIGTGSVVTGGRGKNWNDGFPGATRLSSLAAGTRPEPQPVPNEQEDRHQQEHTLHRDDEPQCV